MHLQSQGSRMEIASRSWSGEVTGQLGAEGAVLTGPPSPGGLHSWAPAGLRA